MTVHSRKEVFMELKYIHYLQAIAARKSISAAARVLYVSQSHFEPVPEKI